MYKRQLHILYAYGLIKEDRDRIQTLINAVLRATGLSIMTPQVYLDMCLGTSLDAFIKQMVIMSGLKILGKNFKDSLDRLHRFRKPFIVGTYMHYFQKLWNDSELSFRVAISILPNFIEIKNYLKKSRKLTYDNSIHDKFKYKPYKMEDL